MKLQWSKSLAPDFANYKIYRDTQAGVDTNDTLVTTITEQNTTSYTVEQLSADTAYYFKVYVYDTEPLSTGSNEVSASTTDGNAPSAVTLSDPSDVGSSWLTLSWTKSTDDEFASYRIYRDTSAGVDENDTLLVTITDVNVTEYQVTGLAQSTQYYFKVYVNDVESLSAGSNEKNATTTSDQSPAAVTLDDLNDVRGDRITLSWSANSDPDFKEYRIYRDVHAGVDTNDPLVATISYPGMTRHTDTYYVNDNATYYYKVYVYDDGNNNTGSNEKSATTPEDVAPTNVSITSPEASASVGGKHVKVTAKASDETRIYRLCIKAGLIQVASYTFGEDGPTSVEWTFDWDASTYSGNVTLKAVAFDADDSEGEEGEDYNATESAGVTVSVSNPNPSVSIGAPLSGDTVAGAAVPVVADYERTSPSTSGITKLELFVDSEQTAHATQDFGTTYPSEGGRWTLSWDTTGYSNASHTIKVKATDAQDNYTNSSTQTVTVDNAAGNVPPTRVVLEDPYNVTDTTLNLHWTENEDTDFAKYEVHKSTTQSFTPGAGTLAKTVTQAERTTWRVADLTPNTTYYFKIKVYDDAGTPLSVVSNEVDATTSTTAALFNDPPAGSTVIVERREYDAAGRMIAKYDGNGNGTFYEYNAAGRTTKVTDALGNSTTYAYDNAGRKASETNALSKTTTYAYDNANRLTSVTDALNHATSFAYDKNGNQTRATDPLSHATTYTYDSRGRLTKVKDALNNETDYEYDGVGNKTKVIDPLDHYSSYTYNAVNRLTTATDPLSNSISYQYDAVGNRTSVTDQESNATTYTYNNRNWVTKITDALSKETTFAYDAVGNRTSVTDPESHATSYAYNWQRHVKQITFADSRVEKHAFDAAGNMIAKLDGEENTTRYEYDAVNRLVKKDYPSGTDTTYTYNAVGWRTQMVDSSGTTNFAYDDVGGRTSVTYPGSKTVSYQYDNAGRRTKMTDPDSGETTYSYDNANRLTSLTNPNNETTSSTYNAAGLVTEQTNGNSTETLYTYNAADWITDVTNQQSDETLLSSFEYLYDDVGNRTQMTESVLKTDNQNYDDATVYYTYDALYRLTEEKRTTSNFYWYVYEYDDAGNRTKLTEKDQQGDPTGTTNYTYDAGNKLQTAGNITYDWDDNGNLESKTVGQETLTYSYDYENHMTQLEDGTTYTFAYDGDGYRREISDGSSTRKFIYDWNTGMPGLDPLVMETDGQGATLVTYTAGDGILSQRRSATTKWYLPDAQGSTRQLANSSQNITDLYQFSAFGNTIASAGSTTNAFRYAGGYNYYKDTQSGLHLLGVRYYDSALGRFISADPSRRERNLYAYAASRPTVLVDPGGEVCAYGPRIWTGETVLKRGKITGYSWELADAHHAWYDENLCICTWQQYAHRPMLVRTTYWQVVCCIEWTAEPGWPECIRAPWWVSYCYTRTITETEWLPRKEPIGGAAQNTARGKSCSRACEKEGSPFEGSAF